MTISTDNRLRFLLVALLLVATACARADESLPPATEQPRAPEPPVTAPTDQWLRMADSTVPLTEVAAAPFDGAVWVVGGLDSRGQAARDVQVYDPTFDVWGPGPELPETLHHTALVATDRGLMVIGGYRGPGYDAPEARVWVLDAATGDWAEGPALPEPRAAGAAAWDGSRVVYGGGVGPGGLRADVFALQGDAWERVGAFTVPREHLGAASDGQGRVWFMGGRTAGLNTNRAEIDLVEGERVEIVAHVPTPRGGASAFWSAETGACLVGGEGPRGTFSAVECVDARGEVSELPELSVARHGLGVAVLNGIAYALLGGPEPGLHVSPAVEALRVGR